MSDHNPTKNTRPNPYVGPRAYNFGEQIYGRDLETYKLVNLLSAERIVLFYSPSGAGKTSLIRAALIPEMREREFHVRQMIRVNREPSTRPSAENFNRYIFSMLSSLEEVFPKEDQIVESELVNLNLADYLVRRPIAADFTYEVFIFDQFEEILTLDPTDRETKQAFFNQVGAMLNNRSRWALFSMREDFVAALDPFIRPVPTRFSARFRLDLLGAAAAAKAMQEPAFQAGVTFSETAAKTLIDDLCMVQVQHPGGDVVKQPGPYVEPVQLQVVCVRLWENLSDQKTVIDDAAVSLIGDVDTALAKYYDNQVTAAASAAGVSERIIREWIENKLITKQGIRGQALLGSNQSEGLPNTVITLLDKAHLVRIENRGGAFWLELSHDRLVQPIQNSNSAWLRANLSMLQRQAALWKEGNEQKSLLLHGEALKEAEKWAALNKSELTEADSTYLKECQDSQERELSDRALAEQAIKLEEQTRLGAKLRQRAVWLAGALIGVLVILIIAIVLGLAAVSSANTAEQQTNIALTAEQDSQYQAKTAVYAENITRMQIATISVAQAEAVQQAATATAALGQAEIQKVTAEAASRIAQTEKANAEEASRQAAAAAKDADKQRSIALFNSLISNSLINIDYRPDLSLLLGVEAYRISPTLKAKSALLTALQHNTSQTLAPYPKSIPQQYSTIRVIAFQPNSNNIAWTTFSDTTDMWNIETQTQIWDKKLFTKNTALAFSIDGKLLAVGGYNPEIYLVNASDGSVYKTVRSDIPVILSLAFSPDGKYLAAVGSGSSIYLWQTDNYDTEPTILNPRESGVLRALAWSPDSTFVAGAGNNPMVWVWDVTNRGVAQKISSPLLSINNLSWAPNGQWLAMGGNGLLNKTAAVWDKISGDVSAVPNIAREVISVAFSPDSKVLALGGYNQRVTLLDSKTFLPIAPAIETDGAIVTLAFRSGKPSLLAWGNGNASIGLYGLNDQQPFYQYLPRLPGEVQSVHITTQQTVTVSLKVNGFIRIYHVDLQNGDSNLIYSPPYEVTELSLLSPIGNILVRGKEDGVINTINYASGAPALRSDPAIQKYSGTITSMALSADNKIVAIGICTQTNLEIGSCLENAIVLRSMADGELVNGPGHFSDIANGIAFPAFQKGTITSLAFDPAGLYLASGSSDSSIAIWDLKTGQLVVDPFHNHLYTVSSLAFSQDGRQLASGDANGNIVLWDLASLQPIGDPLVGLAFPITSLAFSPDNTRLLSGYETGDLSVWDIGIDSWVQRACAIANRNLTNDEWQQYLTGERYTTTCVSK